MLLDVQDNSAQWAKVVTSATEVPLGSVPTPGSVPVPAAESKRAGSDEDDAASRRRSKSMHSVKGEFLLLSFLTAQASELFLFATEILSCLL